MGNNKKFTLNKQSFVDNITKYFSASAIIVLLLALSLTQNNYLGTYNVKNLLRDPAALMIMASGATMVLLLGSTDLSIGAVCSVSNVLFVRLMLVWQESIPNPVVLGLLCLLCCLTFGALSGLLLGTIQCKLKVPSFITSLGFMSVWQSVALLITQNPETIPKALWPTINWYKATIFGVFGVPLLIALIILLVIYCVTKYTSFGKAVYAIGGNERAARIAGIDVDKTKITVFTVNGITAALGGVMLVGSLKSSAPTIGDAYTLQVIASCALGGTALTGGKGGLLGTILGVFTVAVINNGMTFVGVDAYWQNVVFGAFVLGCIALTADRKTRGLAVK